MSPLGKKKREGVTRKSEWSVRGQGKGFGNKYVNVAVKGDRVEIMWLDVEACGMRSFSPAHLRELILHVEGPLTRYPDMWLHWKDSAGRTIFAHLDDGKFTGNDRPIERGWVDWEDLKHAFEEALEEFPAEAKKEEAKA